MNSHRAVNRLPHDILHDLFVLCNEDAVASSVEYFSVTLSHVCSSWRSSALATPTIWSTLCTCNPYSPRSQAYFARSQQIPITIVILAMSPSPHPSQFEFLVENAHRIRKLGFRCGDSAQILRLFGCLAVGMPILETFSISTRPAGSSQPTEFILLFAPGDSVPCRTPTPAIVNQSASWSTWNAENLTQLSLNGLGRDARPSLEGLWSILTACKSTLEILEFKGWAPLQDDPNMVLTPVVLPALQTFVLYFVDDAAPFAALICTPNLRCLTLYDGMAIRETYPGEETDFPGCDVSRLLGNFAATGAPIDHLFLYGLRDCPRSEVDRFFAALPKLRSISLCDVGQTFQDALFQPESRFRTPSSIVFPEVGYLALTDVPSSDLGRFLLRHKVQPVTALKSVFMTHEQRSTAVDSFLGHILDLCVVETGLEVLAAKPFCRPCEE
ncbi:hypothetical protein C8R43DRAFT_1238681 [Mycena crocata]|nr:hypothetical protein C8R43DRAFT_1238681 [Mycena crocata]